MKSADNQDIAEKVAFMQGSTDAGDTQQKSGARVRSGGRGVSK